jgi:DMSO reductase family type II enzyme heme b subunit
VPANAWQTVEAVPVVVGPLWWRDFDDPALRVAALHDGKALAVRLTWRDARANASAVQPDEFEDMAAVQLFKGEMEPFVGMGAVDRTIDLWLWRAGWQADADADSKLDDYPFDTPAYRPLLKGKRRTCRTS